MTIRKFDPYPPRGYVDVPQTWASARPAIGVHEGAAKRSGTSATGEAACWLNPVGWSDRSGCPGCTVVRTGYIPAIFPVSSFPSRLFKFAAESGRSIMTGVSSRSRRGHSPGRGNVQEPDGIPALDATRGSVKGSAAMSRTEALPVRWMPPIDSGYSSPVPLLIQVPRFSPHPAHSRRPVQAPVMSTSPQGRSGRRRRLRREVRVAGCTVLALLPLVLAFWSWPATTPDGASGAHVLSIPYQSVHRKGLPGDGGTGIWTSAATPSPIPPVLLSVEPFGASGDADGETTVVFPGYLLPDDNREEPAHEGS